MHTSVVNLPKTVSIVLAFLAVQFCIAGEANAVYCYRDTVIDDSLKRETVAADDTLTQEEFRKEKFIAAVLAFPVPFGFTGMHRIYLGSGPWVPVVYLCTGGGGFGLLPLIDFIFILKSDREEFEKYLANPKLFMWVE